MYEINSFSSSSSQTRPYSSDCKEEEEEYPLYLLDGEDRESLKRQRCEPDCFFDGAYDPSWGMTDFKSSKKVQEIPQTEALRRVKLLESPMDCDFNRKTFGRVEKLERLAES